MRNRKGKRRRRATGKRAYSRPDKSSSSGGSGSRRSYVDLMVTEPMTTSRKKTSAAQRELMAAEILDRLESTGYSTIAVTHTVFGAPKPGTREDRADQVVFDGGGSPAAAGGGKGKKRPSLTVLRRLHAVVENLSDVGIYAVTSGGQEMDSSCSATTKKASPQQLLNEYDLVSVCPRNDATFQAACVSATMADILTLDYAAGRGGQLPFRIRPADARAAVQRDAVFEIPYSAAVVSASKNHRRGFVRTCRELQVACLGLKPRVLLSSGNRNLVLSPAGGEASSAEGDVGAMALRTPGDLINLLHVVGGFDMRTSIDALGASGRFAIERAKKRRFGPQSVAISVSVERGDGKVGSGLQTDTAAGKKRKLAAKDVTIAAKGSASDYEEHVVEDGFISFA